MSNFRNSSVLSSISSLPVAFILQSRMDNPFSKLTWNASQPIPTEIYQKINISHALCVCQVYTKHQNSHWLEFSLGWHTTEANATCLTSFDR